MNENELDIRQKFLEIEERPKFEILFGEDSELAQKVAAHKAWLNSIRHEYPRTSHPFKVGVYIRYFNQTKYENYLDFHIKHFTDTIALCPRWTLVDIYVDEGSTAPNMESASEWSRLLQDAVDGKVDLIITQKVSNVSRKPYEISMVARMLACLKKPVGIFFISENIYTLASYYQEDLHDYDFLGEGLEPLPDNDDEFGGYLNDRS